jgi:RNA polymerase II subunit A C-terminal domain phosphatase SSU72
VLLAIKHFALSKFDFLFSVVPSLFIMSNRSFGGPSLPRPVTPPGIAPLENHLPKSKISFGVVCSSNINRSMEAHLVLGNAGLRVESYGSGTQVRLPGKTAMEPKIFKFGTPYEHMFHNLALDDAEYFSRNGVLQLCRRGAAVKRAPNRWQDTPTDVIQSHAVVIAFEERIYDAVIEDLQIREPTEDFKPIHVICLDTKDNPQEAALQGQVALDLCWRLEHAADEIDERAAEIIDVFQQERIHVTPIRILYQVCYL